MPTFSFTLEPEIAGNDVSSPSGSLTGFGLSTAGFSPNGLGTPATTTQLVGPGYQQSAGGCVSSVLIAQGTKDYVYDDYGNEKPMSDTAQRMYFLMCTTRGSRQNWQTFGLETPTHIVDSTIQREVERYVRTACKPVVDDGSAKITDVEVTTEGNKVVAVIRWLDMKTQREGESVSVPLAQ